MASGRRTWRDGTREYMISWFDFIGSRLIKGHELVVSREPTGVATRWSRSAAWWRNLILRAFCWVPWKLLWSSKSFSLFTPFDDWLLRFQKPNTLFVLEFHLQLFRLNHRVLLLWVSFKELFFYWVHFWFFFADFSKAGKCDFNMLRPQWK